MAKFYFLDHSLCNAGGHHFDYASCVVQAAHESGLETIIGANLKWQPDSSEAAKLEQYGNVYPAFPYTAYQRDSYLAGMQHLMQTTWTDELFSSNYPLAQTLLGGIRQFKRMRKHRRRIERFTQRYAEGCETFFNLAPASAGDIVLVPTTSELELFGLGRYFENKPDAVLAHWHFVFHFNVLEGRTPEYDRQHRLAAAIKQRFKTSLAKLPLDSVHFYTTTESLAEQYNRLGVAKFTPLPYPVSPRFLVDQTSASAVQAGGQKTPLRFACPGEARPEKGQVNYLQPFVDKIWSKHLATGDVQLVLQQPGKPQPIKIKPRPWWKLRKKRKFTFKNHVVEPLRLPVESGEKLPAPHPLDYFSYPLSDTEYCDLIKSADCGLLYYDSRIYFGRRAGVLGELLSAGKPVIVPAGSWLAEQIQEPIFKQADFLIESAATVRTIDPLNETQQNVSPSSSSAGSISFDQQNVRPSFQFDREPNESIMSLVFDWESPISSGIYCEIEMSQADAAGVETATRTKVVGQRAHGKINVPFRIQPESKTFSISLRHAYHDSVVRIKNVEIKVLTMPQDAEAYPLGQVGVIASDQNDLPACVDEIVAHIEHYRQTSLDFSGPWYAEHDPRETVACLAANSNSDVARRAA